MKTENLGKYLLSWPEGVFPLGGDALALGEFATVRKNWRVCDLGTGSGVLLLLLAQREENLELCGAELDPAAAAAARGNLAAAGLPGEICCGDLRQKLFPAGSFQLVISNPPWFPVGSGKSGGRARSEETCTLQELCAEASRLLQNRGRFALCHRPERLADVICCLRSCRLEPKRLKLVTFEQGRTPSLLLAEAVKGGGAGLQIEIQDPCRPQPPQP